MIDWGIGHYEQTAAELEPVAEHIISLARLQPGERVLDLATGTGNAALHSARSGAIVTGLDRAPRLIDVASARAEAGQLDVSFVVGDIQELPFDDGAFDVAVSVFGLIFAADPRRAFGEMSRTLRPGGRALLSVWVPAGPIDAMVGTFGRAAAAASGSPPRDRFAWHEDQAISGLAAPYSAELRFHEGEHRVSAPSREAYLAATEQSHPMSVAGRPLLERAGSYDEVRERALAILREGNEDPRAFRVTSPYRVIELRYPG